MNMIYRLISLTILFLRSLTHSHSLRTFCYPCRPSHSLAQPSKQQVPQGGKEVRERKWAIRTIQAFCQTVAGHRSIVVRVVDTIHVVQSVTIIVQHIWVDDVRIIRTGHGVIVHRCGDWCRQGSWCWCRRNCRCWNWCWNWWRRRWRRVTTCGRWIGRELTNTLFDKLLHRIDAGIHTWKADSSTPFSKRDNPDDISRCREQRASTIALAGVLELCICANHGLDV
jgi:hypothetical protein